MYKTNHLTLLSNWNLMECCLDDIIKNKNSLSGAVLKGRTDWGWQWKCMFTSIVINTCFLLNDITAVQYIYVLNVMLDSFLLQSSLCEAAERRWTDDWHFMTRPSSADHTEGREGIVFSRGLIRFLVVLVERHWEKKESEVLWDCC